jgi:hypothetical protein
MSLETREPQWGVGTQNSWVVERQITRGDSVRAGEPG